MTHEQRHPSLVQVLAAPFSVMGIVNVTPDSFYDGGRYAAHEEAVRHAIELAEAGAGVLDIGGESTRPGAPAVVEEEETRRVVPVIESVASRCSIPISVDTSKASVARRALDAGAAWINDISAGRFDGVMPELAAARGCPVVLMHSRGTPRTMQQEPFYRDVLAEVEHELFSAVERFRAQGVSDGNILLDPGFGFAKRFEDNLVLLANIDKLVSQGYPLLVGTSRKSFIGRLTGKESEERLAGSLGSVAAAYVRGAHLFRVHDVSATVDMLRVLSAVTTHESTTVSSVRM